MSDWNECLFLEGKEKIIKHFYNKRALLFVGLGFDPRVCSIADMFIRSDVSLSICALDYNEVGIQENTGIRRSEGNWKTLNSLCDEYNINLSRLNIPMYKKTGIKGTLVISESVRANVNTEIIKGFNTIIIDISAMPKGVSFSLIKQLLRIKEKEQKISIVICENSKYDDSIISKIGEEAAEYLPGFNTFSLMMEQDEHETVWLPLLGMDDSHAIRIIANFIKPIEICPVIPFPSIDIRRGEKMLRVCGEVLFRERGVEKRNIIYVPENDPRLVSQKLINTIKYYKEAFHLREGTGIQYVFSSSSSKLIDIGLLLSILSLNKEGIDTGIVIVEKQGYKLTADYSMAEEMYYCLCLNEKIYEW